jgi:hypothetical protein
VSGDEWVIPWGVRTAGYPIIVWAAEQRAAVGLALEWLDFVDHAGQRQGAADRVGAVRLGEARRWREVEPLWQTQEPGAWEAARERAARMRTLLGVKRWWLAISAVSD